MTDPKPCLPECAHYSGSTPEAQHDPNCPNAPKAEAPEPKLGDYLLNEPKPAPEPQEVDDSCGDSCDCGFGCPHGNGCLYECECHIEALKRTACEGPSVREQRRLMLCGCGHYKAMHAVYEDHEECQAGESCECDRFAPEPPKAEAPEPRKIRIRNGVVEEQPAPDPPKQEQGGLSKGSVLALANASRREEELLAPLRAKLATVEAERDAAKDKLKNIEHYHACNRGGSEAQWCVCDYCSKRRKESGK
jgi:hypothetical protein